MADQKMIEAHGHTIYWGNGVDGAYAFIGEHAGKRPVTSRNLPGTSAEQLRDSMIAAAVECNGFEYTDPIKWNLNHYNRASGKSKKESV